MQLQTIKFTADEQSLQRTSGGSLFASSTVSYIRALFDLGDNWGSWGAVRAVWKSRTQQIATVLVDGACMVPAEVLANTGQVYVNLVASEVSGNVVTDRLTSYPVLALVVDAQALVDGSETAEITPSQFEQFVNAVEGFSDQAIDARDRAEAAQEAAETAQGKAEDAQEAAETAQEKAEAAQGKAEDAQEAAEAALHEFTTPTASADTLQPGSAATAAYSAGHFTFGIPQGEKGDPGDQGQTGATPDISIGSVTTGEPGTDAAASITGTAENPVLNLTIPRGDPGEVTEEQLFDILPVETASGAIASFSDGAKNVPLKSLVVDIDPVQDLHGYDNPWPAGGGKNLLKLRANGSYPISSTGITATISDGKITLNGTTTIGGGRKAPLSDNFTLKAGTYIISPVNQTSPYIRIYVNKASDESGIAYSSGSAFTLSEDTEVFVGINVEAGGTYSNVSIYPQIESGSTITSYAPYENNCPISGWTGAKVPVTGFNVWDEVYQLGYWNSSGNFVSNSSGYMSSKNPIPVKPSTQYCMTNGAQVSYYVAYYTKDGTFIKRETRNYQLNSNGRLFTTPENCAYIQFSTFDGYGTTYNHDISINYPSTDHDYHAYTGRVIPITWSDEAGTVYGGTLDVTSGVLTVDKAKVKLSDLSWNGYSSPSNGIFRAPIDGILCPGRQTPSSAISDALSAKAYAPITGSDYGRFAVTNDTGRLVIPTNMLYTTVPNFLANMGDIVIVYPLATPIEYTIDPHTLNTLLGQNNIWADTGDTVAEYRADIQLFINKMLANALSA